MSREELLQRGYCCGQGCKECPYWPRYRYGSTVVKDKVNESKFNKLFNSIFKKQNK